MERTALEEQARILLPGISAIKNRAEIQHFLAETRKQMEETHTDQHFVAVETRGAFFQSGIDTEVENEVAGKLKIALSQGVHFVEIGDRMFLFGHFQKGGTTFFVAEDSQEVKASIHADLKRHLVAVAIALAVGIGIINGVLWLAFQRPLAILTSAVGEIGSGKIGLQIPTIGTAEFDILATAINSMSRALAQAEDARAAQMRKARAIQESLRPVRLHLEGAEIACHFQSTESVGGDYYDLFLLSDGSGLFCIADVAGHGISAALVAAMVKTCLLGAIEQTSDCGEILGIVNRRLNAMNLPDMFVSMLLVRVCTNRAEVEFAGAGHPAAVIVNSDGQFREIESNGPILGIGFDYSWATERQSIAFGDRLLLYTDGVSEASGVNNSNFGTARLKDTMRATYKSPTGQAIEAIVNALIKHCDGQGFADDVTMMLVDIR